MTKPLGKLGRLTTFASSRRARAEVSSNLANGGAPPEAWDLNVLDTATINLTYNATTKTLSADFIGSSSSTLHSVKAVTLLGTAVTTGATAFITFDGTDEWDSDNWHNPSSNPSRVTVTQDGLYMLSWGVQPVNGGGGPLTVPSSWGATPIINGGTPATNFAEEYMVESAIGIRAKRADVQVQLSAGDYVELQFYNNGTGQTLTVNAEFIVTRLGSL